MKVVFVCPFNLERLTGTPIRTKVTIKSVKRLHTVEIVATAGEGVMETGNVGIGAFTVRVLKYLRTQRPQVLHGVSTLSVFPMLIYKLFFDHRTRIIFEMHGWSWYELEGKSSFIKRFIFLFLDSLGYLFADSVISMSHSQKNFLSNAFHIKKNISVIWGPADFKINNNTPVESTVFRVGYLGNDSFWQGLSAVLDAADLLGQDSRIVFELAGFDFSDAKKFPLKSNIVYRGKVQRVDVPGFISSMDIMLSPRIKGNVSDLQYPQKISEYLAAGRPVIVSDTNDQKLIVNQAKCGYVLSKVNGESIARTLQHHFSLTKAERDEYCRHAAEFAEQEMCISVFEEKMKVVYSALEARVA